MIQKTAEVRKKLIFFALSTLFIFLSGFSLVLLFRSYSPGLPAREKKAELIEKIKNAEKTRNSLKVELKELQKKLENLEKKASKTDSEIERIKKDLDRMRAEAGLTEIEGSGLEITLQDAENTGDVLDEQKIVHDSDLRLVVNALFIGGARAVSINGERVAPFTAIRCVGPTILVNNRRVTSPFKIEAVGDPERLEAGLLKEPQISRYLYELFPSIGIGVKIVKKSQIKISAYSGSYMVDTNLVKVID